MSGMFYFYDEVLKNSGIRSLFTLNLRHKKTSQLLEVFIAPF
jgi:hypothetical protein